MAGIYIHIPFCIKKCNYCSFLSFPSDEVTRERYVKALVKEISRRKVNFTSSIVSTVYFGGGTPSVLSADQIGRILTAVRERFDLNEDAEITLEANPGTLGNVKQTLHNATNEDVELTLHKYRELGINRLSMGVQSMNDDVLRFIGRIHSSEDVRRDFRLAREAGFDNINLDLIFSLPVRGIGNAEVGSQEQALKDLDELIRLEPEHISCYSLQIEDGTPFGRMYDEGKIFEVPDDEDRETYHKIIARLKEAGYEHYEISNFAKSGRRSRHNSSYWDMSEYIAFGLGASGFTSGTRYKNTSDMKTYLASTRDEKWDELREEVHVNTEYDNISEAVFTGLRRVEGISYKEAIRFLNASDNSDAGEIFWQYYKDAKKEAESFAETGHLIIDNNGLRLTEQGIDISNKIMSLFV